ncbi:MAG: PDZ domain-containing protein [Candidatus Dormibacteraeota bacterium]|nr:PDZ domain-containing protein [Candidatus Dormibacteraeota bacterium]MBV9526462.1 PDZ domain-containing protein [Candidatus Dormibacteraeota bacterium]
MDRRARLRSPAAIAAAALLLAAVLGATGFLLERASTTIGGAAAAVVAVAGDLVGGAIVHGSGVLITPSGDVVTSYHNVGGALTIHVLVPSTSSGYVAAVAGLDPTDDLALLQLENVSGLPSVSLDARALSVNDHVTAVGANTSGSPLEAQLAVSKLNQSATALHPSSTNAQNLTGLVQLSGQIPASACGGALVDAGGDVVGIDTVGGGPPGQQGSADVAFATPAALVATIVHDILTGTPDPRILQGGGAFLGVDVHDSLSPPGAAVAGIEAGSPAQAAGITPGDVVVALGSTPVDSVASLHDAVQRHHPGDRVTVVWLDPTGARRAATVVLVAGSAF